MNEDRTNAGVPAWSRAPRALGGATIALVLGACGGAAGPSNETARLGGDYAAALEAEGTAAANPTRYLDNLDRAVRLPDSPDSLPLALTSLDALVWGSAAGFDQMNATAVAFRSADGLRETIRRLEKSWLAAESNDKSPPSAAIVRGFIAGALHDVALYTGDLRASDTWGSRRGCAQQATVIGPFDWASLTAIEGPSPIAPNAPLADVYPGIAPFAAQTKPVVVHADSCELDVNATSYLAGARAVVIDIESSRAQRATFALTTQSAATLEVGGQRVLVRSFTSGGHLVTRMASVDLPEGTVRAVIRVAQRGESSRVELDAFGETGLPLAMHAPRKGDVAKGVASNPRPILVAPADRASQDEVALAAAALLTIGEARQAEHLLEPLPGQPTTGRRPAVDMLYARALEAADDVPENKANERARGATDRVLAAWPNHWEARIARARAIERRKGAAEGGGEALHYLEGAQAGGAHDRMIAAYAALLAKRMSLLDVAQNAYGELVDEAKGSLLAAAVELRLNGRTGADAVKVACEGFGNHADVSCLEARREVGDYDGALDELARLRQLRDAPDGLRDLELDLRIAAGDPKGALAVYEAMHAPARRMLEGLGYTAGAGQTDVAAQKLLRDKTTARDAPYAIASVQRIIDAARGTPDRVAAFELDGKKIVEQDRASAFLPGAATAILKHTEEYSIEAGGLVHFWAYDLRRVQGTTDVAAGSFAFGPSIEGRSSQRLLRKRIHKRDGRVLEPDAAANASQSSDLSQLEQGDYVEQIAEGWGLPGDNGQLILDTPDLLPERTSVREAVVELRRPANVAFALWSHPLMGKVVERTEGTTKVSTWRLQNQAPRRIEDGVPKMDRNVGVSIGTMTWANVGIALQENLRVLDDDDPIVKRWAEQAVGSDRTPSRDLVTRLVTAAGKTVKVAGGSDLGDVSALFSSGSQRSTVRGILELGQGSRSWVIYRALRELGIGADIAVAEVEPFSAFADYPAHPGRFRHPLVVAHLGNAGGDVWIDADIEGPPLPAGRISPELRGRTAMLPGGKTVVVEGSSGELGDEVDVRLTLDDKGEAKGTFTILLHGRQAQTIADAFETIVGSDRRELLRSVVLAWVPWADVQDVDVSSTEGSWEVALRAAIAIHGYGRPEGKDGKTWSLAGLEPVHEVLPRMYVGTLAGNYASRAARQNALAIERPVQYHLHRVVELPSGATIARPPPLVNVAEPRLAASRKIAVTGTSVEEDFTINLPTGTVPAEQYQSFVERVHAVDDGFMAGMRIRLGGPALPKAKP